MQVIGAPLKMSHVCPSRAGRAGCGLSPLQAVADVLQKGAPETLPSAKNLNKYSSRITQPKSQGASQAMLYATGLKGEDMNKPQVRRHSAVDEGEALIWMGNMLRVRLCADANVNGNARLGCSLRLYAGASSC